MGFEDNLERTGNPIAYGQQLKYLVTGDTGTYSQGSLEDDIIKKFPLLTTRLRYLIEDAALFETADFIDPEQWQMLWQELDNEAQKNPIFDRPRGVRDISEEAYPCYSFGIQLGHLARLLGKNGTPEFRDTDIAFGFLIGLGGNFMADFDSSPTDKHVDDTGTILSGPSAQISRFMRRVQEATNAAESSSSFDHPDAMYAMEALKDAGLDTVPPLQEELIERANELESLYPAVFSSNPQPTQDHLSREWGPMPSQGIFLDIVSDLKSDKRISRAQQLAKCISKDIDALENNRYRGLDNPLSASEVFYAICLEDKLTNIKGVVRDHRRGSTPNQAIATLRNNLLGKNTDYTRWIEYPLAKEDGHSALTDYGRLVGIIFTPDAKDRETDKYLPEPMNDDVYTFPSKEQILIACYACAFGQSGEYHKTIFEKAYQERIPDKLLPLP